MRITDRIPKPLLAAVRFALPVLILGWLFWSIEPEQWEALGEQPKSLPLLGGACAIALLAILTTFFRWAMLVRCLGIQLGMIEALRLGAIGFLLSFVSAGSVGGDLFKAVFLARRSSGRAVEAFASVAVDRMVGLFGLLLVGAAALLWTPPSSENGQLVAIRDFALIAVAVGAVLLLVLVFGGRSIDRALRMVGRRRWTGRAVHRIADPLRVFHTHRIAFAASLVMSVTVHGLFVASMYLIARGLYANPPSLGDHLVIVPAAMLAGSLPITPGGLGVFEAAMEQLYRLVPAVPSAASGTLVAVVFELVRLLLAAAGIVFYWTAGRDVRKSLEPADEAVIAAGSG